MNVHLNATHSVGTPQAAQPTRAVAQSDGWFPVEEAFVPNNACSLDDPELCQIFAQMGQQHEAAKAGRHGIVMGAQQEVRTIHDQVAEQSRNTQLELSNLARQASIGGMSSFSSMGPAGFGGSYGYSGVNTGVSVGTPNMLSSSATAFMSDPRMDDPNYLRSLPDSQLQMMGLDPTMVRMYCMAPQNYPGGLRSMLQSNGSYYNPYAR